MDAHFLAHLSTVAFTFCQDFDFKTRFCGIVRRRSWRRCQIDWRLVFSEPFGGDRAFADRGRCVIRFLWGWNFSDFDTWRGSRKDLWGLAATDQCDSSETSKTKALADNHGRLIVTELERILMVVGNSHHESKRRPVRESLCFDTSIMRSNR